MAEIHRKRRRSFKVRLLEEELEMLAAKADEAGLTKSEYVRNVIYFGAAHERAMFEKEQADLLRYEINRIGNNVNQIALKVNTNRAADKSDFNALRESLIELLSVYDRFIRGKSNGDY